MAEDSVDLLVRWSEAGAEVPQRTARNLKDLKDIGDQQPAVWDRMGQAFTRLEGRQPTMVLRRLRMEMDMLLASAVGVPGPLGRLGASFAMLGLGSPVMLGAAAAAAGVGLEVKGILDFTNQLDESLQRVETRFAQMVPAAAKAREAAQFRSILGDEDGSGGELEKQLMPAEPGMFTRLAIRLQNLFSPDFEGSLQKALNQRTLAALTGIKDIADLSTTQDRQQHTKATEDAARAEAARNLTLVQEQIAVEKLRVGTGPASDALLALQHRADELRVAASTLNPVQRQRLQNLLDEQRNLERLNALTRITPPFATRRELAAPSGFMAGTGAPREIGIGAPGPETPPELRLLGAPSFRMLGDGSAMRVPTMVGADEARRSFDAVAQAGLTAALHTGMLVENERHLTQITNEARRLIEQSITPQQTYAAHLEILDQAMRDGTLAILYGAQATEMYTRAKEHEKEVLDKATRHQGADAGSYISAAFGIAGAIAGGGGGGAVVSSIGNLVSLDPRLKVLGEIMQGFGGLLGLTGQRPKVTITAFEEEAARQIRELRGDPLTTSYIIISSDPRQTQYEQGRLQRRDSITRGPR